MYNFLELKQEVAKLAQRYGDSDYTSKIGAWLNLSQKFLYDSYDYFAELEDTYDFTSVADREDYPLPNRFDKPLRIKDLTNKKDITIITEEKYVDDNLSAVADSDTDVPGYARIYGASGITGTIGSSGTTLQVKSSSSDDDDSVVVRVEGYINSSKTIIDAEEITISAATPTTFVAGTKTFYGITQISKSDDTTGYITIADSDDTTLAIMSPEDRVTRNLVLKLGLIPDDAYDYRIWFKKKYRKMVDDYDYPFTDADNYFILDAWGWALSEEKETLERALSVWNKAEKSLLTFLGNKQGRLGPNYQHKVVTKFAQAHRT